MNSGKKAPNCGERLLKLRTGSGYTQMEVKNKIGCGEKAYRIWESSDRLKIRTEYLEELADLYHVSTDYILCRTDDITIGNEEIQKAIGLSEKSIEVLRYIKANSESDWNSDNVEHRWCLDALNYLLEDRYEEMLEKREKGYGITTVFNMIGNFIFPDHVDTINDPDEGITGIYTKGMGHILTKAELFAEREWQNMRKKLDEYRERNLKSAGK